jgi:predicted RND superfamily exporter protein
MTTHNFIVKNRRTIIIVSLLLVLICIIPLSNARINSDLLSYLPADLPEVVNKNKVEEYFGVQDPIILVFQTGDVLNDSTLARIKALSKAFNRMNDFDLVLSLFDTKNIKGEWGSMLVDPAVKRIPKTPEKREKLRKELMENELAYQFVVSEDFSSTLILLNSVSHKEDDDLMNLIVEKLKEFPGQEDVYINGQPYLRAEAKEKIAKDFVILLPLGLLIMGLFLWLSFREKRGVILPAIVVFSSIIISLALVPLFGWDLSIIGILIPIMMIAIANDYGIHFIAKYQELNARFPEMGMKEMVSKTLFYLKKPVILTGLTTIVGISGLMTHVMLPAKQMGIVSAIGIGFALVASLLLIPAIMLFMKKGKPHKSFLQNEEKGLMDKILVRIAQQITTRPRLFIWIFTLFLVIASVGISRLKIASDFDGILPKDHSYNISLRILNKQFNGTKNFSVLFSGDIKDPELLKRMIQYEEEFERIPGVSSVNSIASMIRIMSKALNEPGDSLYNKIPNTRNAVAQYLELYSMNGDPEDLEDLVDFNYTRAIMQIQFIAENLKEANQIIETVQNKVQHDENYQIMGGMGVVENRLNQAIATGQVSSLAFAFLAIMILLMIIFRSFKAGFIGSLPLIFAVISTFGIMGWLGIELDIVTALLSSISIGLGVDYSIHIFWRIKDELKKGNTYSQSVITSLTTAGRGITINAYSVIVGFSVLFLSGFSLIHLFAFLIVLSILLCLLSSLILIPSICLLVKPKFLEK